MMTNPRPAGERFDPDKRLSDDECRAVVHGAIVEALLRMTFDDELDKVTHRRLRKHVAVWMKYHQGWADKIMNKMEG